MKAPEPCLQKVRLFVVKALLGRETRQTIGAGAFALKVVAETSVKLIEFAEALADVPCLALELDFDFVVLGE